MQLIASFIFIGTITIDALVNCFGVLALRVKTLSADIYKRKSLFSSSNRPFSTFVINVRYDITKYVDRKHAFILVSLIKAMTYRRLF